MSTLAGKIAVIGFGDEAVTIAPFSDLPFARDNGQELLKEAIHMNK